LTRAAICELGIEPAANDRASTRDDRITISLVENHPTATSVPGIHCQIASAHGQQRRKRG
jgi:hypothetical protein